MGHAMAEKFDAQTTVIGELFDNGVFFRVPLYQRPFAWVDRNFEELIDDLIGAEWDSDYFLGTLVLHEQVDGTNFDIIDGQQRLTSIALLLACLRDLIDNKELADNLQDLIKQKGNALKQIPEKIRLEVRAPEVFDKIVSSDQGTVQKKPPLGWSDPEFRYFNAIAIFKDRIQRLTPNEVADFSRFLISNCKLVSLSTKSFDEAFRLFEIVNDRGRRLRRIDIVKSSNLDPQFVENEGSREYLAARWEELETELGEDLFEQVFFHIRLMLVKDKPQADILKEFELRVYKRNVKSKGKEFLEYCYNVIEAYRRIFVNGSAFSDGKYKNKIVSLLDAMDKNFSASEWRACVLTYFLKFGEDNFLDFLYRIERVYMYHWVSGIRKDERFSDYVNIINIIELNIKSVDVVSVLGDLESKDRYDDAIKKACERPDFYNAGFSKYFLLRLELVNSEFDNPKYYAVKSVEHVLPQNPAPGTDWMDWYDDAEREALVHSIGNLVLLSKGKNAAASNKGFIPKKDTYLKGRVSEFPRSIKVLSYDSWEASAIAARANEAVTTLLNEL